MTNYLAYKLGQENRDKLLQAFPPKYPLLKADHVTIQLKEPETLPYADTIDVIGIADDNNGIQALIVEVNGSMYRPDGRVYHITWSLDPDKVAPAEFDINKPPEKRKERPYKPFHSNALILRDLESGKITFFDRPISLGAHKSVFVIKDAPKAQTPVRSPQSKNSK